jgi:hypothetical protein
MKTQRLLGTLYVPSISCRDSILRINTLGLLNLDVMNLATVTIICIVYRIGDTVAFSEIDDDLSPNFIDPLVTKYGFDNVKWFVVPTKS